MPDDERQQLFEAQTRKQFEALGRFVQAFEHMVFAVRSSIESRLQQESPDMVYFTRMIFHHRALTAWPLWEIFRGMVYTDVSELRLISPPDIDIFHSALTKIGHEVEALVSARNNVLHGTPFIGWTSSQQTDFEQMDIFKWGVSAKGWSELKTPKSAADLTKLVARCQGAGSAVRLIAAAAAKQSDASRSHLISQSLEAVTSEVEPLN